MHRIMAQTWRGLPCFLSGDHVLPAAVSDVPAQSLEKRSCRRGPASYRAWRQPASPPVHLFRSAAGRTGRGTVAARQGYRSPASWRTQPGGDPGHGPCIPQPADAGLLRLQRDLPAKPPGHRADPFCPLGGATPAPACRSEDTQYLPAPTAVARVQLSVGQKDPWRLSAAAPGSPSGQDELSLVLSVLTVHCLGGVHGPLSVLSFQCP